MDPRTGTDPLASSPHDKLAALLPELIENTGISGLSIAVVAAGEVAWSGEYGVANVDTGEPVTADTVFEAASLSKPVLAYLALRMIERGELDLDSSLHEILEYERFADTDRARALTPRRVLSHQTGLPNWGGDPLTNSLNGLSIAGQIVEPVVGDISPTTGWLAYEQSTAPTWAPRRQGILTENAGDYEAAITHFARVLELDPDDDSLAPRIAWLRDLLDVAAAPVSIPHELLQRYAGRYGPRTLSLVGSELRYQRQATP